MSEVLLFETNSGFDEDAIDYAEAQGCTICPPMFYWGTIFENKTDEEPSVVLLEQWCDWYISADYAGKIALDIEDIPDGQQWFTRLRNRDADAAQVFITVTEMINGLRPKAQVSFWGAPPLYKCWGDDHWAKISEEERQERLADVLWCRHVWRHLDWFMPEWYQYNYDPNLEQRENEEMFREDVSEMCDDLRRPCSRERTRILTRNRNCPLRPVIPVLWLSCHEGGLRPPDEFQRDDLLTARSLMDDDVIEGVAMWNDPVLPFNTTKPYIDVAVETILGG
jgi:hypothetical protein